MTARHTIEIAHRIRATMAGRFGIVCVALLWLAPLGAWRARAEEVARGKVNFASEIQPILVARCVKCHGSGEAEAGLRLTSSSTAFAALESGARAIVPGRPDESQLLKRVAAVDPDERMPPEGPPLTKDQIDKLRQWIVVGADWPTHWAYRPLTRPLLPPRGTVENNWPQTPIDSFIVQTIAENDLTPSPSADKRTLLRRVYFDLIGLPPTPDELDAFLADDAPDAYSRIVDRLLASPHFGERWARHWMDVVHYAETHGHDQDRPRENAWPYRDYLIRSFNDDKPYGRFVQEQIAGDALFPGDPQAIVATGLLATGPWDESSLRDIREDTLDREIARYLDRDDIVTTVMSTFASSTVHCARCHDHKFDPITQQEYYALQAVFAGTDKANRAYEPDPQIAARRRELTAQLAGLPQLKATRDPSLFDPRLVAEIAEWETAVKSAALTWRVLQPAEFTSAGGATLTKLDDGSFLSSGLRPEKDTYTITANTDEQPVTGIRLEVLTDDRLPLHGPGRQDNGNLHLNEFVVYAAPRDNPSARQRVELQNPKADFNQQGWTIDMALDGNTSTAWGIYPEVGKPHDAVFELKEPIQHAAGTTLAVELHQVHGGGHLIGRPRLSVTGAPQPWPSEVTPLPPNISAVLAIDAGQRNEEQRAELAAFYLESTLNRQLSALAKPQLVYCGTGQFTADGSFRPAGSPRPIHLLARGDVTKPGPAVEPAALSCLANLDSRFTMTDAADEGQRRAALARWMTDPQNALTWRSIANRMWHHHFGRGIVDTPNDFGHMGGAPTHPELLDWLASELREGRESRVESREPEFGSLKRLHRVIVTSAVYCQSSNIPQSSSNQQSAINNQQSVDSDNRWLWRMNRGRLDAESVRDAVLRVSGTLDSTMGGSSVKQFIQSPGVHVTPNVDYLNFNADDPANYRRSVYRFIFRTLPDPFLDALDCPDASQLTPHRNTSLTALQALAMLNDKFMVRQSQHIAERAVADAQFAISIGPPPDGVRETTHREVTAAVRLILGRPPTESECVAVGRYAEKHGLANACRFLLNSNEFMFVD